jgi:hypothetical protein
MGCPLVDQWRGADVRPVKEFPADLHDRGLRSPLRLFDGLSQSHTGSGPRPTGHQNTVDEVDRTEIDAARPIDTADIDLSTFDRSFRVALRDGILADRSQRAQRDLLIVQGPLSGC